MGCNDAKHAYIIQEWVLMTQNLRIYSSKMVYFWGYASMRHSKG